MIGIATGQSVGASRQRDLTAGTLMHPRSRIGSVYLYREMVDFRKSIDGLAVLVEQQQTCTLSLQEFQWLLEGFDLWANQPRETLLIGAFALDQMAINPAPLALASLGFHSIMISFLTFLIWFWLLRHYQASHIGVLPFMTPLFGAGLGAWLLREPAELGFLFGAVRAIFGITLASGNGWSMALLRRRRTGVEYR